MSLASQSHSTGVIESILIGTTHFTLASSSVNAPNKLVGLVIDGKSHWVIHAFDTIDELNKMLEPVDVIVKECGSWGRLDDEDTLVLCGKVTNIDVDNSYFCPTSKEYANIVKRNGSSWWLASEIALKYQCQWLRVLF